MPETQTVDEVVSERAPTQMGGARTARPVVHETVAASGGEAAKTERSGIEQDSISEGGHKGRAFKPSTEKLLAEMDKPAERAPAPHEVGDADEDEPDEPGDDADPAGGEDLEDGAQAPTGDDTGEPAPAAAGETAAPVDEVAQAREAAARLEERNRALVVELETARKTPKAQRTERETSLLAAESAYIDEGTVPALRKFLSVVVGAAPDSKEVDAELAGLYLDLTAREVGVALDQNQQALRDNARTRLLLARDRREKADGDKKAAPDDGVSDAVQYENAAKYVDNLLMVKGQNGASIADEHPMLMALAQDFDGYTPAEVLARAVRQEYLAGTLDPSHGREIDAVRVVAQKIERHYDAVAKKIEAARAKQKKPDTTTPSDKPKAASPSQEQRQSPGARTITNATASVAPATKPPKATKKAPTAEKTRKDFPTDAAWREHLLNKHFES